MDYNQAREQARIIVSESKNIYETIAALLMKHDIDTNRINRENINQCPLFNQGECRLYDAEVK